MFFIYFKEVFICCTDLNDSIQTVFYTEGSTVAVGQVSDC